MIRPLTFDAARAPAVLAALQHAHPAQSAGDAALLLKVASEPLADAWLRVSEPGAQLPRAAVELVLARALEELQPGGLPPGATLFDPGRLNGLFGDVARRAAAPAGDAAVPVAGQAVPPAAERPAAVTRAAAAPALVAAEVARTEQEESIALLRRLENLDTGGISTAGARGIWTLVSVLRSRAGLGDPDVRPADIHRALCQAVINGGRGAVTKTQAVVRELLQPTAAFLEGVATADLTLQQAAVSAHALIHDLPYGRANRDTQWVSALAKEVPAADLADAAKRGARRLLQALVTPPVTEAVARTASDTARALAGEDMWWKPDWPGYELHLTPAELREATATAAAFAIGKPDMGATVLYLRLKELPTTLLSQKRLEFLEAGDARALLNFAKQVLSEKEYHQNITAIEEALDRLAPIGREGFDELANYPAREEKWLATMIDRIRDETFSAPSHHDAAPDLVCLVNWVRGSQRIFIPDVDDELCQRFQAALAAARAREPNATSANAAFLDDRISGAPW